MAGLKLKLAPGERLLVNGALVENGRSPVELRILTPDTKILRLRDAIRPDAADTPVKRLCCLAQLVVAGDAGPDAVLAALEEGIEALRAVLRAPEAVALLDDAAAAAGSGQFYRVLRALRRLLPHEDLLLAHARTRAVEDARPGVRPRRACGRES